MAFKNKYSKTGQSHTPYTGEITKSSQKKAIYFF
jgi:hypothetical protein